MVDIESLKRRCAAKDKDDKNFGIPITEVRELLELFEIRDGEVAKFRAVLTGIVNQSVGFYMLEDIRERAAEALK